ncbi:hypothetical protein Q4Q39_09520 [Flavivirga amylovorans]|uniref:Uncharacterized protein n=1 Tax=Flavivirga amylovorans TaxID=870486 RepID=A0ABT8X136_9FLAO|nr:hypothetical protein [Flavivirga amylovorans]MDO5987636.1 hypothetical protein [Flavivirga amylovorans]
MKTKTLRTNLILLIVGLVLITPIKVQSLSLENPITLETLITDVDLQKFIKDSSQNIDDPYDRGKALDEFIGEILLKKYPQLKDMNHEESVALISEACMSVYNSLNPNCSLCESGCHFCCNFQGTAVFFDCNILYCGFHPVPCN